MNSTEYKIIYELFNNMPTMDNNIAGIIEQYIYKKYKVYQNKNNEEEDQIENEENTDEEEEEDSRKQKVNYVSEYTLRFDEIHGKYIKKEVGTNRILFECNYNYGKLDGEKIRYYKNGNIMKKENYVNDLLDGLYQKYNSRGIMIYSFTYKNGIQHGPFLEWYSTGEINSEGTYENGFLFGRYTSYYSLEDLRENNRNTTWCSINFNKFGVIDGVVKKYGENGILTLEVEYKNGEKNGYLKKYNRRNGCLIKENYYKNGLLHGEYKEYIANNNLALLECNYKDGKLHSTFKKYYITGEINIETTYNNGYIDGKYIVYDEFGSVKINREYKYEDKVNLYFMNQLENDHIYIEHCVNY